MFYVVLINWLCFVRREEEIGTQMRFQYRKTDRWREKLFNCKWVDVVEIA